MIRAVFRNGVLYPLDEVPSEWTEGHELQLEEVPPISQAEREHVESWYQDVEAIASQLEDDESEQLEANLAEADERAKEFVRKQMGLE